MNVRIAISRGISGGLFSSLLALACSSTSSPTAAPGAGACTGDGCTSTGEACAANKLDCNHDATDACEVDGANDPANCGGCGKQCPTGNYCAEGTCVDRCPSSKVPCNKACVDTSTDNANCGACNSACGPGESCEGGQCKGACAEAPCKLIGPQCGCTTGQGCYADDSGKRACLRAGTIAEGQECTLTDDTLCQPGLSCREHKTAGQSVNMCSRMCLVDTDCKGDGSVCWDKVFKGVRACSMQCDPVAQTGCSAGTKCSIVESKDGNYTDCSLKGSATGKQGASCTIGTSSCGPGFNCAGDSVNGTVTYFCAHYCRTKADCPPAHVCDLVTPLKGSAVAYGMCFPQ